MPAKVFDIFDTFMIPVITFVSNFSTKLKVFGHFCSVVRQFQISDCSGSRRGELGGDGGGGLHGGRHWTEQC